MKKLQLKEATRQVKAVMKRYQRDFPDVQVDRDYFPFKLTEEWGECMQTYLMLTDRGRQKGKNKAEIREMFSEEFADVLGFLLLFADSEGIDLEKALHKKWLSRLKDQNPSQK